MSKELEKEYLEDLDHYDEGIGIHSTSYEKCKERLIRLAKIDNANPSEALEELENFELDLDYTLDGTIDRRFINGKSYEEILDIIKQALLKAKEQEKVLEIIKNKQVNVRRAIILRENYQDYIENYGRPFAHCEQLLTQEEFDLLKRYF